MKGTLPPPEGGVRRARFPLSAFKDREKFPELSFCNLREEAGALVLSEGSEEVNILPENTERIYSVNGAVFAFTGDYLYKIDGTLKSRDKCTDPPVCMVYYMTKSGLERVYGVNSSAFQIYTGTSIQTFYAPGGGTCLAMLNDRSFLMSGARIRYSARPDTEDWLKEPYDPLGPGTIELPRDRGNALKLVPRLNLLYIFLDRGIWRLEAQADPCNFKIREYPYCEGRILGRSIADCGSRVLFFTERGFAAFDGNKSVPVDDPLAAEVDLSEEPEAVHWSGRYYARVKFRDGRRGMFVYNVAHGTSYRMDLLTHTIAASDAVYYPLGTKLYRLVASSGYAQGGSGACEFRTGRFRPFANGDHILRSVIVEGEGTFTLTASSEKNTAEGKGSANRRIVFSGAPRGETLSLTVRSSSPDARIVAIDFEWREAPPS